MMIRIIALFTCLLLTAPASLFAEPMTDNWRLTGFTKYRDAVFADQERLSSPAPNTRSVWIKIAPSVKSKYRELIRQYLEPAGKWNQTFKSVEILCEIHCGDHLIRFTRFVYLDQNRTILHDSYDSQPQWFRIFQGNIWFPVEKLACTPSP